MDCARFRSAPLDDDCWSVVSSFLLVVDRTESDCVGGGGGGDNCELESKSDVFDAGTEFCCTWYGDIGCWLDDDDGDGLFSSRLTDWAL